MLAPITVSELNNQIKSLLETTFVNVMVEGEVSRVTYHSSGHLYFTLKDKDSTVSCVMFRGNNQKLKFRVKEGMKIIVSGSVSVYTPRGSYQINCFTLEPAGSGALALAYEQLKKELEQKGYFDRLTKKELPKFPKKIAVVTSKTGAAIEDMLRVAKKRWPLVKIVLLDTIVQGNSAAKSIAQNIKTADTIGADIIVFGRGGGSLEDLWAFNEKIVAEATFEAKTPTVSAVGHEIDVMISDFVADLRAPTPSAAFEMILPDKNEMLMLLDNLKENTDSVLKRVLHKKEEYIRHLRYTYKQNSVEAKIDLHLQEIENLKQRMRSLMRFNLDKKEHQLKDGFSKMYAKSADILIQKAQTLSMLKKAYESADPSKKDKKGFAQIAKNGKVISAEEITQGEEFQVLTSKVEIKAKALFVNKC